jgi:hypothetical protein
MKVPFDDHALPLIQNGRHSCHYLRNIACQNDFSVAYTGLELPLFKLAFESLYYNLQILLNLCIKLRNFGI